MSQGGRLSGGLGASSELGMSVGSARWHCLHLRRRREAPHTSCSFSSHTSCTVMHPFLGTFYVKYFCCRHNVDHRVQRTGGRSVPVTPPSPRKHRLEANHYIGTGFAAFCCAARNRCPVAGG